jgi:hypothetical protein
MSDNAWFRFEPSRDNFQIVGKIGIGAAVTHRLLDESVQRSRNTGLAHPTSVRLGDFHPPHRFRCVSPA